MSLREHDKRKANFMKLKTIEAEIYFMLEDTYTTE